jgi:hypothetical protein
MLPFAIETTHNCVPVADTGIERAKMKQEAVVLANELHK